MPRYRRKRTVSLRVFGENATFHSAYSPKTHNFASSLNTLFIAETAQFYSTFLPTTISLTPRFHRKREVWLRVFAENAQNDPKTHSCEDSAKFIQRFRRQHSAMLRAFGENGEWSKTSNIWANFKNIFRKCWLYCVLYLLVTERFKKKFKNTLLKSRACVPLRDCLTRLNLPESGMIH